MKSIIDKIKLVTKEILLSNSPTFFWIIFSLKRRFGRKKSFGFLSEEFFADKFLKDKVCDIGGFGMTTRIISEYYNSRRNRDFEATALFSRTLHKQSEWRFSVNGSSVLSVPGLDNDYLKSFLRYSYYAQKSFQFLLSIDIFPRYEFSLNTMPHTPLLIWIRDPQGESELRKIATVECEITANKMTSPEEFLNFAKMSRSFFSKIHRQSTVSKRPIVFVTNAHCLALRAKGLYGLRELNPYFLPNPIHYPPVERIQKSKHPTVCLLGRLDPVKRPWIFFELAKKFKNVDFLVCGQSSYPQVMDPIIEQYRSVDNLKFLGLVQGESKAEILSKSWVLVNTSIHEGLPCSFLESFAYGTPVVSSVNPDDLVRRFGFYTGEGLGDGRDESTMKKFQEGLDKLLSNKEQIAQLGLQARECIRKIYCFDAFEKSLKNILAERFKVNYVFDDNKP